MIKLLQEVNSSGGTFYYINYREKLIYLHPENFIDFFLAANGVAYYPGHYPQLSGCLPDMELLLSTAKSLVPPASFEATLRGHYQVPTYVARDVVPGNRVFWTIFSIDTTRLPQEILRWNTHSQFEGSAGEYFARASEVFWGCL